MFARAMRFGAEGNGMQAQEALRVEAADKKALEIKMSGKYKRIKLFGERSHTSKCSVAVPSHTHVLRASPSLTDLKAEPL